MPPIWLKITKMVRVTPLEFLTLLHLDNYLDQFQTDI